LKKTAFAQTKQDIAAVLWVVQSARGGIFNLSKGDSLYTHCTCARSVSTISKYSRRMSFTQAHAIHGGDTLSRSRGHHETKPKYI